LWQEISNVKLAKFIEGGEHLYEMIQFEFRGGKYLGLLKGRNRDLLLGFGEEKDKAIALRVLLDGNVQQLSGQASRKT